jgi:hypothetical protein
VGRVRFHLVASVLSVVAIWSLTGRETEPPEDTTPKPHTCNGTPATCLRLGTGWTFEGQAATFAQSGADPWIVRLDDGRYRLFQRVTIDEPTAWEGLASWISNDGLSFTAETGYRFEGYTLHQHAVVRNPDGSYRLYWLDQKQGFVNGAANKAIKSALSVDGGWTFTEDVGGRLTYSGAGYEANGILACRVLALPDGRFRMYYHAISDHDVILSALSPDGLAFTRESGVRLDRLCPPETLFGGVTPIIDALGAMHVFVQTVRCTGVYENPLDGIFDGTTADGLAISIAQTPFIRGYSKDGTLSNSVGPSDFSVVQTPQGLRVYFVLYGNSTSSPETALYSVINPSIKWAPSLIRPGTPSHAIYSEVTDVTKDDSPRPWCGSLHTTSASRCRTGRHCAHRQPLARCGTRWCGRRCGVVLVGGRPRHRPRAGAGDWRGGHSADAGGQPGNPRFLRDVGDNGDCRRALG